MAISTETMTSCSDWLQYYQHDLSGETQPGQPKIYGGGRVSDSTVVATTFTSTSSVPSPRGIWKPIKRRSRASRRTPTTLLNTDTNNFRAMVQQFTGGPNQTLTTGFQHYPSGANFSFEQRNHVQQVMNPVAASVGPNRYPLQFQQHQQQQLRIDDHQLYQQVLENQPYLVSSLNNFDHVPADAFVQRLDDLRTTSVNGKNNNNNLL